MKQIALSYFEHPYLVLIPLIIFFTFFVYLIITVMRRSNRELFEEFSNIPLYDEEDTVDEQSERRDG